MFVRRRDFIKGLMAIYFLPYSISTVKAGTLRSTPTTIADPNIEKAIKASFGGGFSVLHHNQSKGLTYADISHFDNRYTVASADLQNWKILRSSLRAPVLVFAR